MNEAFDGKGEEHALRMRTGEFMPKEATNRYPLYVKYIISNRSAGIHDKKKGKGKKKKKYLSIAKDSKESKSLVTLFCYLSYSPLFCSIL